MRETTIPTIATFSSLYIAILIAALTDTETFNLARQLILPVMVLFWKILTKTDIKKRLSVPTWKKTCFLKFGGQRKVEFKATDDNGEVWTFVCFRREGDYPKPVLSEGWLPFVRWWKLAVGDKVILSKARGQYRIEVIKRAAKQQRTRGLSPPVQNHDSERTMAVAGSVEEEPTLVSHSTDQAITNDQTEGRPKFEFVSLKPGSQVSQPEFIDFLKSDLGSQPERKKSE